MDLNTPITMKDFNRHNKGPVRYVDKNNKDLMSGAGSNMGTA